MGVTCSVKAITIRYPVTMNESRLHMPKSTAQRQAAYRNKIAGTHKRVEIILDEAVYTKLQTLVEQSGCSTRIDYLTALIEKEYRVLSDNEQPALLGNGTKKIPIQKRVAKKKTAKVTELWRDEKRCQGQTARGTRCRIEHHLSVITYSSGKKTYEVAACKRHIEHFMLHESLLE